MGKNGLVDPQEAANDLLGIKTPTKTQGTAAGKPAALPLSRYLPTYRQLTGESRKATEKPTGGLVESFTTSGSKAKQPTASTPWAGAWISDSAPTATVRERPVMMLPTAPKAIPVLGYERERDALSRGVSLPMARMQAAANTPASLTRQADTVKRELDAAQKKRAALLPEPNMQGATVSYPATATYSKSPELVAAEKEIEVLNARRAGIGARYYEAENREKMGMVGADKELAGTYGSAKEKSDDLLRLSILLQSSADYGTGPATLAEDMKYFKEKYGVPFGSTAEYTALMGKLRGELGESKESLSASGVDFNRLSRYEEKKENEIQAAETQEETAQFADEHPVISSVLSIAASAFQGLDAWFNTLRYAGKSDLGDLGSYEPMSTADFEVSNYVGAVRGTVSKKIEENTNWELFGQNVASFLYNTGMSVGDSAVQIATMGPFATYVMGMSAAANGARDVVARGGSNGQAFAAGLASGAAEAVFEKFSIDNLLTPRSVDSVKSLLMETAKQAGVEASEEMFTEIANMLSDAAIMGQNSNFNNAVRGYMAQGMSEEEAKQKAYLDNLAQVAWAGAGGAVSGGFMGGAVNGANYAGNANINAANRRADTSIDRAYDAMSKHGMFSAEAGDAVRSANRANGLPATGSPYTLPTPEAPLGGIGQEKSAPVKTEAQMLPTASETSAVSQLRPDGSDAVDLSTDTLLQEKGKVNTALEELLQKGKGYAALEKVPGVLTEKLGGDTKGAADALSELLRDGTYGVTAKGEIYKISPERHIDARDMASVGARAVKSFQYENPELHDYFVEAARGLAEDLANTTRGERWATEAVSVDTGEAGTLWTGVKRSTSQQIADLLDDQKLSYNDIQKAIDNIIHDQGQENYAAAKRVELVLDDMLTRGWTTAAGERVPQNQAYIAAKGVLPGGTLLPRAGETVSELLPQANEGLEKGRWDSVLEEDMLPTPESAREGYWDGLLDDAEPEQPSAKERAMWQEAQAKKAQAVAGEYRGTPATDKLGIKVERPITDLGMSQSLRGMEKARYEAGVALNKLLKDSHATEAELRLAQGVADGVFSMEQMLPGMNARLIQEIADAIAVRDSFNKAAIKEQKGRVNWDFDAKVQELIKNSDEKTSPGTLSLNANTMQRNTERTWGKDAAPINGELFDPVMTNEAERIRFVNRTLEQMEQYRLNTDESGMVQRLVEGQITEGELRAKGYDAQRLSAAAKTLTGIYSDFYAAINDFLVAHGYKEIGFQKNYAPHMQEEQIGTLQKYLQQLGFQTQVNELPTDLAGRTDAFKPGKQYDPYFQPRVGNKTVYDAVGGLESYVNYLSNVFYHTDDIQKLRRFSEALRTKYSAAELGAELDRLNHLDDRLAAEDAELLGRESIEDMKTAAFERYGNMSRFGSYVSVLDDYTNILAGKQSKFDRAVESLLGRKALNLGRNIQGAFSKAAILGNLSSAINQTVQLPQLVAEVGPKYTVRAVYDVVTGKTGRDGFTQESDFLTGKKGIQSISEKSGSERIFDIAAKPFEVVDDFSSRVIVRAKYLEQIAQGMDHAAALKAADQFANRMVGSRMKGAKPVLFEQKNPLSKLVTTFQLEVANGWEHIVHDLPMEIHTIAETKGKGAAVKRTAELVVASQIAAFIANAIIKGITGREPVPFDGLGMMANYFASGYGVTKEEYLASLADSGAEIVTGSRPLGTERTDGEFNLPRALQTAGEDTLEDIPYVSNIASLLGIADGRLPLPQVWNNQLGRAAGQFGTAFTAETPEERQAAFGQGIAGAGEGLASAAATWLPMGSQVKKTLQGGQALARGGVYSRYGDEERLQYNVEQTPANVARGLLFGRSALPEADAYYAEGAKTLSAKQTETYQQLLGSGVEGKTAYQVIQDLRSIKKTETESETLARANTLQASELLPEQQAVLYRGMLASDTEQELMTKLEQEETDNAEVYQALVNIRRAVDSVTGKEDSNKKRDAIREALLTDAQKIILYRGRISDQRDDDISAVMETGLGFDDFLLAQNEYNTLYNQKGSASEKGTEFAHWLNRQGYTGTQFDAMRKAFKFYSQIPNDETIYERFVRAGVDDNTAYDLTGQLSELEPVDGKDQVSALQKDRVIVDSGMDDAVKVAALGEVMSESDYIKLSTAYQYSVPPDAYVSYRERLTLVDVNGTVTQAEAKLAIDSLDLTREQKAALWQLQNTSWKPYKNPYSQSVGTRVLAAYESEKATKEVAEVPRSKYAPNNTDAPSAAPGRSKYARAGA